MKRFVSLAVATVMVPALAFAGEITLFNTSGGPVEIRAVRKGVVKIPNGEARTFLYQAEDGDFRVWTAENKCENVFLYETADDAKLQFVSGPLLFKLPPAADKAAEPAALRSAQPKAWPMAPATVECD